ncbi:MAG: TolC family protein [Gammaproteobacteria bacterium]|nr:TolC family protein [Gammaproteobacteria bacterium]
MVALPAGAARETRKPLALAAPETEAVHNDPASGGGLTLQQAIDLAFERNPSLQAAAERYGEAQAQVEQSVAAFYPRLSARVAYNYTDNPGEAFYYIVSQRRFAPGDINRINDPGWVENFRPEVFGVWSLFRGGQDFYKRKAAELGVEQAELEQSALHNHLAAAVTSAYYALALAPRQVEVAQHSLTAVTSELLQARARHAEGVGLKSDVLSLEVRLAEARESEVQALNAVELARSGLMTLLGGNDGKPVAIVATGGPEPATGVADLPKVLEEAHARRPELQAADRLVQMRQHELQAERGAHLPRVNAYAAYGQNLRAPGFSTAKQNTSIGISAELDLFTGGETTAKVSAAERRVAEAEAQREENRLQIEKEVRDAHTRIRDAIERLKVTRAAVAAAEEALRLVHEQYRGGSATVTRYLEAEADRAGAQARALAARYQAYVTEANLKKAAGYWR